MTRRRRIGGRLAGCLTVLLATGCGSTVRLVHATSSPAPIAPSAGAVTAPVGSSGLSVPASAWAGAAGDGSPAAVGAPAPAPGRTLAPGTPLRLGFVVAAGNTYTDPTGTQQVTENFDAIVPALVADLNAHGGIAGHPVEEFRAHVPATDASIGQQTTDEEAACQQLTQDHKVFAVLAVFPIRYSTKCYAEAHTPVIARAFVGSLDAQTLRAGAPWVIDDDSPDLDTIARLFAATLVREHAVSRKIGIAAPDDPRDHQVVEHVLLPALKAVGAALPSSQDVFYAQDDLEHAVAASANAVLRWKTDGVDTVIPFDIGPAWGVLGVAAHQAQFTPRWVLDSSGRPQWVLDDQAQVAPPADERRAVAVGYSPGYDVLDSDYPLLPAERHCLQVVNRAIGTTYTHRTYGQGAGPLVVCRLLALSQQALAPYAHRPLVGRQLIDAVHALGSGYVPLDLPRSLFAAGKPDGIAVYRTSRYVDSCSCMRYDSGWTPIR